MYGSLATEDNHVRAIIHIDLDCFYAQVETIKKPSLKNVPLGIQQKNIVVTSNYKAREFGIRKCMLVTEALTLCPNLVLVKGEDLHDYREVSYKVTNHLQKYSPLVERLGLDENYVDVTELVSEKLKESKEFKVIGNVVGESSDMCLCGCYERLTVATNIAQSIRESLLKELKLTSCAGVAHNKLLAKLCCATHKPNQQSVVFPNSALELLANLTSIKDIPGIGRVMYESLQKIGLEKIEDVQNCSIDKLKEILGPEKAQQVFNLCNGKDLSLVKGSGKPLSIGLEDSCRSITGESEVKSKIQQLLKRIMVLVNEDGRIPRKIKLVVRKFDSANKISRRETKQCNLNPNLFSKINGVKLNEASENKLVNQIMGLFVKIVDVRKPYHITLLGLSFSKLQDIARGRSSITSFLKKDIEVQAVTNIESKNQSNNLMDYVNTPYSDINTDGSESEVEPSPKKTKLSTTLSRRKCFNIDYPSPSKLNVASLRINSKDSMSSDNQQIPCPPNADEEVFKELPRDVQEELWREYKNDRNPPKIHQIKKPKLNTLLNYWVKN